MNLYSMSQPFLAQFFGAIGSAVRSGDAGSICSAHKPFGLPLARFSTWRERIFNNMTCKPEHSGRIGDSVGSNVWLVMLVCLRLLHLRSPSTVSQPHLLKYLALMW